MKGDFWEMRDIMLLKNCARYQIWIGVLLKDKNSNLTDIDKINYYLNLLRNAQRT